jgi:EAL domain-containing protein (putative c-di-GMP-specific phosphodiesterase class I)
MLDFYPSLLSTESTESIYPQLDIQNNLSLFISHELRTPLTSIQGVLGLLHSGQLGELSEEGHRLLTIALNNTQRLTRLACAIERESTAAFTLLSPIEIEQLQLENELYQAFIRNQLRLAYQPIVQLTPRRITSFEVLTRWHHPVKGEIPPSRFIPMAERSGMIHEIGLWVLEQACHQLARWQQQFHQRSPLCISVNLSAIQLLQTDLPQQVQQVLQATAISPHSLKLEVTETALIQNQSLAMALLNDLRQMGVQIYVDDFGTGYSSLARLQDLPIDALKIDRSFIHAKRWDISEAIIHLAAKLGLDVIAEGIETLEELCALQTFGCQQMQGYFFSKPLEVEAATAFLDTHSKSPIE